MGGDEQIDGSPMPVTGSMCNWVAQGAGLADKIYFEICFEQKEAAKAAGLRWDSAIRKWYAPSAEIAKAFSQAADFDAAPVQPERVYFKVPFLQKDRAKAIGMRFDGVRKLWFAPNPTSAVDAARTFERMFELSDDHDRA